MSDRPSKNILAGQREAGALCSCCGEEIATGIAVTVCQDCGEVHHSPCWQQRGGCCSYQCSSGSIASEDQVGPILTVSHNELADVVPLPTRSNFHDASDSAEEESQPRRWNRTSVGAFIVAVLGIPLFGLVTGLIAIVLACIALVVHTQNKRGMGLAVAAIIVGLADVFGWAVFLSSQWGSPHMAVSLSELRIDPSSLEDLSEPIARAMRANVVIQVTHGFGRGGMGSGVVLKVNEDSAFIVTNRHVLDQNFTDATTTVPLDLKSIAKVAVMTFDQATVAGVIEWIAPYGIDLAIISAPISILNAREAHWNTTLPPHIGDNVFAVGNPHGLGWTHTSGSVSQIRRQTRGVCDYKIIQTSAAINSGNSGGGLYDDQGRLVGINTMTAQKSIAEGLGFSIALPILLELVPDRFHIHDQNPSDN